jgi:hypothetical protein
MLALALVWALVTFESAAADCHGSYFGCPVCPADVECENDFVGEVLKSLVNGDDTNDDDDWTLAPPPVAAQVNGPTGSGSDPDGYVYFRVEWPNDAPPSGALDIEFTIEVDSHDAGVTFPQGKSQTFTFEALPNETHVVSFPFEKAAAGDVEIGWQVSGMDTAGKSESITGRFVDDSSSSHGGPSATRISLDDAFLIGLFVGLLVALLVFLVVRPK